MLFWKKCLLVLCFIGTMYFGGMCVQNEAPFMQGLGLLIVIFSFIILYSISQVMWFGLSFVQSFFLIGSITVFILYCFGIIGQSDIADNYNRKIGQDEATEKSSDVYSPQIEEREVSPEEIEALGIQMFGAENAEDNDVEKGDEYQSDADQPIDGEQDKNLSNTSLFSKIKNAFSHNSKGQNQIFNPMDYDYVEGNVSIVTGSILKMRNIYIHLLGVDAPDRSQTCADYHGASYDCGMKAVTWLQDWLNNRPVRCYLVGNIVNGHVTGTCFVDNHKYDVAAVMANSGWALAYTKNVSIYIPYEKQARENRRGLWQGHFYKPWDWRKIQNRKVEITIEDPNGGLNRIKNWFKGLF